MLVSGYAVMVMEIGADERLKLMYANAQCCNGLVVLVVVGVRCASGQPRHAHHQCSFLGHKNAAMEHEGQREGFSNEHYNEVIFPRATLRASSEDRQGLWV